MSHGVALVFAAGSVEAQSSRDSAAAQAIALTSTSAIVTMNPGMFGESLRSAAGFNYAHKPRWKTAGGSVNIGNFRIEFGKSRFEYAPHDKHYFVGIDFARSLTKTTVLPKTDLIVGADASIGYGAVDYGDGFGDVAATTGFFLATAARARLGPVVVTPYFAPGFFSGRFTTVLPSSRRSETGWRITQGGGVRITLLDRLTAEMAVRKTRIAGAVPRYGFGVWYQAAPLPAGIQSNVRNLRVEMDNDYYAFWLAPKKRPDEDYTNGIRISFDRTRPLQPFERLTPTAARCPQSATQRRCARSRIEFGQEIHTPTDDSDLHLQYDRPYAGWLYGAYSGHLLTEKEDRAATMTVGIIGPPSMAKEVQKAFHALFPWYRHPNGWERQLSFEPGIIASYSRTYLLGSESGSTAYVQAIPEWRVSVGNVLTGASGSALIRLGYQLPHPWLGSPNPTGSEFSAYVFGRAREDLVLRNIFLDGNTFRGHSQVDRVPWVWQREVGVGTKIGFLSAEYRAVVRAREYQTRYREPQPIGLAAGSSLKSPVQIPQTHPYGSLSITINKSF